MYEFATVALLGLVVCKLVDLTGHVRPLSRATRVGLAVVLGLGLTWATDYSAFAGWGIRFRELWMGPIATGLAIAGLASVWHEVLGMVGSYAKRGQPAGSETHIRAA